MEKISVSLILRKLVSSSQTKRSEFASTKFSKSLILLFKGTSWNLLFFSKHESFISASGYNLSPSSLDYYWKFIVRSHYRQVIKVPEFNTDHFFLTLKFKFFCLMPDYFLGRRIIEIGDSHKKKGQKYKIKWSLSSEIKKGFFIPIIIP